MEIKVKRTMESKKGVLSGKNVRLFVEIGVSLSEEEKALIQKYHDPFIFIDDDIPQYFKSKEAFDVIKGIQGETNLSKFEITAHVEDGFHCMGNLVTFEKAVITELTDKLDYLKSLDGWESEETVKA